MPRRLWETAIVAILPGEQLGDIRAQLAVVRFFSKLAYRPSL
jgi:hypothetical protein